MHRSSRIGIQRDMGRVANGYGQTGTVRERGVSMCLATQLSGHVLHVEKLLVPVKNAHPLVRGNTANGDVDLAVMGGQSVNNGRYCARWHDTFKIGYEDRTVYIRMALSTLCSTYTAAGERN